MARATAAAHALATSAVMCAQRPALERRAWRLSVPQAKAASFVPRASRGVVKRRARRRPQCNCAAGAGGQQRQHGGILPNWAGAGVPEAAQHARVPQRARCVRARAQPRAALLQGAPGC